ncbi:polysaccharide biosynthesis/export family protein [Agrobacterium larrymoorei]|uniref:Polysaccharide biosynthesis/export family protein n=1 Tax=Agrobacterium larrymoorei TaxID=160699 RepID=A0A4D7E3V3_9HYPH|nr:polysaccharide biosynthesis/export family protein [Agrobacterium larrymoorei]QCJ00807.1 polysaccharide export protein [Agrobacterium larrymoorei]QYA10471.1 polysaccharide export protein [Agrobacterium larrymoorei]WHA43958.1 polysaccharide biosynthesis/export family protein [Agrobacterium larrymoorei]
MGTKLKRSKTHIFLLIAATSLSSCTSLPSAGPAARSVEAGAAVKVTSADKPAAVGIDYALVDINKSVLSFVSDTAPTSLSKGFGGGRGGAPALPLGVGDVVQVSVFESQSGGLFIPSDAGSRPGNFVSLPQQTIDRNGTVSVPYAGRVRAVGRAVEAVQKEIEDRLVNRAIEPQVLITKISSRSAQAAVLGDVRSPAKIELTEAGERVLDVISEAGGLSAPGIETRITLQRGGRSATVQYDYLVATPAENIYVAPGDTILVDRERRTYSAFGASGLNGRFDFEESKLSFGEALAKAGGVLDARADPAQVFLYRVVPKDSLAKIGVNVSRFTSETVPVVFRANMRDPSALFAIQKFPMQDKDIIYITNADSVELLKFLNIVNSVSSTAAGVPSDAVSVRDSVRTLTR